MDIDIIIIVQNPTGDHFVCGVFTCSLAFHVEIVYKTLLSDFYIRVRIESRVIYT